MSQLVAVVTPSNGGVLIDRYREAYNRLRGYRSRHVEKPAAKQPEPVGLPVEQDVKPHLSTVPEAVDSGVTEAVSPPVVATSFVSPSTMIIRRIAKEFGVTVEELRGPDRRKRIAHIRHAAMYACVVETKLSYPQIGAAFNRDHSTVINAVRTHCRLTGATLPRTLPPGNIEGRRRRAREHHRMYRAK